MSPLNSIQQMDLHEASTTTIRFSSLLSISPKSSDHGSSTLMPPPLQASCLAYVKAAFSHHYPSPAGQSGPSDAPPPQKRKRDPQTPGPSLVQCCFDARPLAPAVPNSQSTPAPYAPSLAPMPSPLRPHVPAKDRLQLWLLLHPCNILDNYGLPTNLAFEDLERIKALLEEAWAGSTRESYGSGLLVYHIFCDRKGIPEEQCVPASPILVAAFLSTIASAYLGNSVSNYVHGVRAWHILHGVEWRIDAAELSALLKAADKVTPPSSRRPKRTPYTIDFILAIHEKLDLSTPLHVAVFACLMTTFYTSARAGEFTIPKLNAFSSQLHIMPAGICTEVNRRGLKSTVFHLPSTKVVPVGGEDVSWCPQSGL